MKSFAPNEQISPFPPVKVESRTVRRSWEKLEKKVQTSLGKLNQADLETFLTTGVCYCPKREMYYIHPDLEMRVVNMIKNIVNKTGSIDFSVIELILKAYQEGLNIQQRVFNEYDLRANIKSHRSRNIV